MRIVLVNADGRVRIFADVSYFRIHALVMRKNRFPDDFLDPLTFTSLTLYRDFHIMSSSLNPREDGQPIKLDGRTGVIFLRGIRSSPRQRAVQEPDADGMCVKRSSSVFTPSQRICKWRTFRRARGIYTLPLPCSSARPILLDQHTDIQCFVAQLCENSAQNSNTLRSLSCQRQWRYLVLTTLKLCDRNLGGATEYWAKNCSFSTRKYFA